MKFYKCPNCGKIMNDLEKDVQKNICCDRTMEEVIPNNSGASELKHKPIYKKDGEKIIVKVGVDKHPMESEHHILWLAIVGDNMFKKVDLKISDEINIEFPYLKNSKIYAYCNLHGLWETEVI